MSFFGPKTVAERQEDVVEDVISRANKIEKLDRLIGKEVRAVSKILANNASFLKKYQESFEKAEVIADLRKNTTVEDVKPMLEEMKEAVAKLLSEVGKVTGDVKTENRLFHKMTVQFKEEVKIERKEETSREHIDSEIIQELKKIEDLERDYEGFNVRAKLLNCMADMSALKRALDEAEEKIDKMIDSDDKKYIMRGLAILKGTVTLPYTSAMKIINDKDRQIYYFIHRIHEGMDSVRNNLRRFA